jgi:hypothetical protein
VGFFEGAGYRSRYSDWLLPGRLRARSSSFSKGKDLLFSTLSRPALGPVQLPIQWVQKGFLTGVKRFGCDADHSSPTSAEEKKTWIYEYIYPLANTPS